MCEMFVKNVTSLQRDYSDILVNPSRGFLMPLQIQAIPKLCPFLWVPQSLISDWQSGPFQWGGAEAGGVTEQGRAWGWIWCYSTGCCLQGQLFVMTNILSHCLPTLFTHWIISEPYKSVEIMHFIWANVIGRVKVKRLVWSVWEWPTHISLWYWFSLHSHLNLSGNTVRFV